MDQQIFKDGLSRWGSGVAVITTTGLDEEPVGFTATSFTSLSLEPPLVLFCLSKTASGITSFQGSQKFGVNILSSGQEMLSNRFASRDEKKFEGVELLGHGNELPLIKGCLANLICEKRGEIPGGDHLIFIGEVLEINLEEGEPLLYFKGKYRT